MTADLTQVLYTVARQLSTEVGPGLRKRAAAALDEQLDGKDLREIAIRYLVDEARGIARSRTALAEREATLAKLDAELPDLSKEQRERWPYMSEDLRERARQSAERQREFRLRDERETAGHIGGRKPGSTSKDNDCRQCERCRQAWEAHDEIARAHTERLRTIGRQYETELRAELFVEWTEKLLSTEIAMPDGSRTTWGLATIEQHRLRHDMLAHNAMANMTNATRHSLAIELLEKTGAPNLISATAEAMAS